MGKDIKAEAAKLLRQCTPMQIAGLYLVGIDDSKDGYCRCNIPWNRVKELNKKRLEYLESVITDRKIENACEMHGIALEEVVDICRHMIGMDIRAPYHRHGKAYYKAYRNYFDAPKGGNRHLDVLPSYILERQESGRGVWYTLTKEGLDWLGRQLKTKIRQKEGEK